MKKHLIAVGIAAMGLASSAHALGPSVTPDYVVYASGGSAQANAVYVATLSLLSSVDSYTDSSTCAESGSWRILFGTTTAQLDDGLGTTIPAGKNVLFMYRFTGGTFLNGIQAVAQASTATTYPAVADILNTTTTVSCGGAPHATQKFTIVASLGGQIPDFGLSDEEVGLFNNTLNVTGTYTSVGSLSKFTPGNPLSAATVANLTTNALYTNLVGIAATLPLYNGTWSSPAHPKTNFTKSEVAGILTGSIKNWNQLRADDGTQLPNQKMILLDRAPGSGTKAAVSQYFLQNPVAKSGGGALTPYNETTSAGGGGPTGSVPTATCSSTVPATNVDFNEGSSSTLFADLSSMSGNNCLAVGILGLEFAPEVQNLNYQFVSINGADPYARVTSGSHTFATYANEINGTYDLMYDNSFNYRTASINGGGFLGDTTYHSVFINSFLTALSSSSLPGGVSGGVFPAGVTGALLDPFVSGAVTCSTLGSRLGGSSVPLQLFTKAPTAVPACNDQLK